MQFIPARHESAVENTLVHGNNEWITKVAYNIASQSFWKESRTWLIIDLLFNYMGNDIPDENASPFLELDSIPAEQMDVAAPDYFLRLLSRDEITAAGVTERYSIPFRYCSVPGLVEMARMNWNAGYTSTLEMVMHQLQVERRGAATVRDVCSALEEMAVNENYPPQLGWTLRMLADKLLRMDGSVLASDPWSPIGASFFKALSEGRPRWIVLALGHAQSPSDALLPPMIEAVLRELREFCKLLRLNRIRMNIGIMVNGVDAWLQKTRSSSLAVGDLLHGWGRTARIPILCTTSRADELPGNYFTRSRSMMFGTFHEIIECHNDGHATLFDSLEPDVRESRNGGTKTVPRIAANFVPAEPAVSVNQDRASPAFSERSASAAGSIDRTG